MGKLIVFGDSYCANTIPSDQYWWKIVADTLNVEVVNYAVSGSSLNYSISKYYEYLNSNYYVNDTILFVCTSGLRSPLVHQFFPPNLSALAELFYKINFDISLIDNRFPEKLIRHFRENSKFYETWFEFYDEKNHLALVNLLRESLANLPNKKILLSGFDDSLSDRFARSHDFHLGGCLFDISKAEYVSDQAYVASRTAMVPDSRPNHLSADNHIILARIVNESLNGSYSSLNSGEFMRGFLNA